MNKIVHLAIDPLFRTSLKERLLKNGYYPEIFELDKSAKTDFPCGLILQPHLCPEFQDKLSRSTPIVMLGILPRLSYWFEAKSRFPSAFITFRDSPDYIFYSLEQVLRENQYLSETVLDVICSDRKSRQEELLEIDLSRHLTRSELEVLALIARGYTTAEIAGQRVRSIHTISTQRKSIRQKLEIINGERLAVFAGRHADAVKTLLLIENETRMLEKLCRNTT